MAQANVTSVAGTSTLRKLSAAVVSKSAEGATMPSARVEPLKGGGVWAFQQKALLMAGLALVALVGCASGPHEGKYAWSEGWRKGQVVAVQMAGEMGRPQFYTCVRNMGTEQLASTRFAIVEFREMSRTHRRAVPLQAGDTVLVGDKVYLKVDDCNAPLPHRLPGNLGK